MVSPNINKYAPTLITTQRTMWTSTYVYFLANHYSHLLEAKYSPTTLILTLATTLTVTLMNCSSSSYDTSTERCLWLINPHLTLFASPNFCIVPSAWNKTGTSFYPLINLQSITVWRHRWRHQYTNIWRHIWRHQYIWRHRWRHQHTNIWNIIDFPYFEKSQTN